MTGTTSGLDTRQTSGIFLLCLASIVLVLGTPAAAAIQETHILFASDADEFDNLGWSVAVSGNLIVAGAPGDEPRPSSGSAYVFDATTGQELHKLVPSYSIKQGVFGVSVAIDGSIAVIGAPVVDEIPGTELVDVNEPGSAFVFDAVTGQELFKLNPDDSAIHDQFGRSVAISGSTAVITATGDAHTGEHSGSAYVFDITTGQQLRKLTATDAAEGDYFGTSVAIDGNIAVIGATSDYTPGNRAGSAYVFDITTGEQLFKLTTLDVAYFDYYGRSVAAANDIALVGAPEYWYDGGAGYVSVFDTATGELLRTLKADDGEAGDYFGWTVALDDDLAFIGAYGDRSEEAGYGSVYIFDIRTGEQLDKLTAPYFGESDAFGFAVARDGGTAVVGAQVDIGSGVNSGTVHVFNDIPEPMTACILGIGAYVLVGRSRGLCRAV
jgi:WD40 repeat protein